MRDVVVEGRAARTMAPGTVSLVEVLTARSSSAAATVITFAVGRS
jgi:hypothetical protein